MSAVHSTLKLFDGKAASTPMASKRDNSEPKFPLFRHASGQWAKKIRGKLHYFGTDADAALTKYLADKDALHAGRSPRPDPNASTVKDAVNDFLHTKKELVQSGELTDRSWEEYKEITDILISKLGKGRLVDDLGPDDFAKLRTAFARRWGPVRLGNAIQRVRSVFKHAFDAGLVDRPVRFGPGFARPSKKVLRRHRAQKGPQMFTASEIREMIDGALVVGENGPELVKAGPQLRAMILLGINCGFGNTDVGTLPLSALDLERGWVDFPRPKTGISRRCPLWPETVDAIKEAQAHRYETDKPEYAGLVFLTKRRLPWAKGTPSNPLSHEMRKLLDKLKINGSRNFYCLRHGFETIGGAAKDQIAVDAIMGHAREDMGGAYCEYVDDDRLCAVTDHVRGWLFGQGKA